MHALPFTQMLLTPCRWPRSARRGSWAVLLALVLAMAAFMHVAHTHEADAPATYKFCSFCTTFDRGSAPPPVAVTAVTRQPPVALAVVVEAAAPAGTAIRTPRQSRAPPTLQA